MLSYEKNNLLIVLGLILLVSCSHRIDIRIPSSRFMTAETTGKLLDGNVTISSKSGTRARIDLSDSKTDNALELKHQSAGISPDINLGLGEKIDLFYFHGYQAPDMLGLKYQLIGKSQKDKQVGHSLAISFMAGAEGIKAQQGEDLELIAMDEDTEADISFGGSDAALIYSYRIDEAQIFYASLFIAKYSFVGKLKSEVQALDDEEIKNSTWVQGASIGAVRYFNATYLALEASGHTTKWDHTEEKNFGTINMALGFRWH